MLFVSVCAIGWGSEAVIINAALKEDVSSEVALALRQMTSSITYGLVVLPFIGYSSLFELLPQGSLILIIAVAGVLGTLSYLNYYKADRHDWCDTSHGIKYFLSCLGIFDPILD